MTPLTTTILRLFVLLTAVATMADSVAAAEKTTPVVVAIAAVKELAPVRWYAGSVVSRADLQVSAEESGRLVSIAEVGSIVRKGEPIARVDDELLQLEQVERKAEIRKIKARLQFFKLEVKRLQRLSKQNNAAQSQLEQAISDYAATQNELQAAQARERYTGKRLQHCVIRAPADGVVAKRLLEVGEWADTGAAVITLMDPRLLVVQSWVPANILPFVRPGTALKLDVEGRVFQATVRIQVPVTDSRSRLYELRIQPQTDTLRIGQSVRVAVPVAMPEPVLVVPRDALVLRRDAISVIRINGQDIAEQIPVTTGLASGSLIEVKGDLQAGDRVVIRGGERLRGGQAVSLQTLDEPG